MTQCGFGIGANKEYFPESGEMFPACPDCMWEWLQFLSTISDKASVVCQAEAIATMIANVSSSRVDVNPKDFIK